VSTPFTMQVFRYSDQPMPIGIVLEDSHHDSRLYRTH
jgi:hypothetical protein